MSTAVQTQQIATSSTSGQPIVLGYGLGWVTGKPLAKYMLQGTGSSALDYTRVGGWALGRGEWDANVELWINDKLVWKGDDADPSQFHFHRGSDAVVGSGLTPSSSGPDQGVDSFWSSFPPAINPLCYSGIAYYMIKRKQAIVGGNNDQSDASQWTDIAPIGLWRMRRVRLFDDHGNQTGYAYTNNPAWCYVDALLTRKIKPDYIVDLVNGPDPLTEAERARFDWGSIYESAQYYDQFLSNGRRRFTLNCFFGQASLAQIQEQMLLSCRSYRQEYAGKEYLICDKPRPSVFTFTRKHAISLHPSDKALHSAPNRMVGKFRDVMVPAAAEIASISQFTDGPASPKITTVAPHPIVSGDNIIIGGQGAPWDGEWVVLYVPPPPTPTSPPPTWLVLKKKGSSYPATAPGGGLIGLAYSRFKERTPEFQHKRNQLARGAIGVGITRQRQPIRQEYELGAMSWDQTARLMEYEKLRQLGPDAAPYVTPRRVVLKVPYFSKDEFGKLASAIQPGDHITIDSTASVPYAGEYEVIDPMVVRPYSMQAQGNDGSLIMAPNPSGGELEMQLQEYREDYMIDASVSLQAGWQDVPDSDVGGDSGTTFVPTIVGGLAFWTGALASGGAYPLPSSGYNPANQLGWASPQGYLMSGAAIIAPEMNGIYACNVASQRATLQYGGRGAGLVGLSLTWGNTTWGGPVNFAALAWQSSGSVTVQTVGSITYVVITLSNGEKICFGQGIVADGATFSLPTGFVTGQMLAWSSPYDMGYPLPGSGGDNSSVGTPPIWKAADCATWIDGTPPTTVHMRYYPSPGQSQPGTILNGYVTQYPPSSWPGRAQVLIFAWQNNSGSVTTEAVTGGSYAKIAIDGTVTLCVGLVRLSDGQTLPNPSGVNLTGISIQTIASPRSVASLATPTKGVKSCYLDNTNKLSMTWDGGAGDAMVFALLAAPPA